MLASVAASAQTPAYPPLTEKQHLRIEQITTIFENSTTDFQYAYIEDIEDGAGITCGRVGFTTYHGALLELVKTYTKASPENPLAAYIPCLEKIKDTADYACLFPSVPAEKLATHEFKAKDLVNFDFAAAFKKAADEPALKKAQDDFVEEEIFKPALEKAKALNVHSPLGIAMLYDTAVQTGYDKPMGIDGIVERMKTKPDKEEDWLAAYMQSRLDTLQHPFRPDGTRFEKPEYNTVPRAEALIQLLNAKNFTLTAPIKFTYFDEAFTIK